MTSHYSMISDSFCNFDESSVLVGDAAYFVDPLFSSGVTFAAATGSCADLLIRSTLNPEEGRFMKTLQQLARIEPSPDDVVLPSPELELRFGRTVEVPGLKASIPPADLPAPLRQVIAEYWRRLPEPSPAVGSPKLGPAPFGRFYLRSRPETEIRFFPMRENGEEILRLLQRGQITYGELTSSLAPAQIRVLKRMIAADMAVVRPARNDAAVSENAAVTSVGAAATSAKTVRSPAVTLPQTD